MRNSTANLEDEIEELEPQYESPAHRQIGRALDRYGIPFFYRQATLVYEDGRHRIRHPDFTLPGYNGLVVEYAGHPNGDAYHQHRRDVYALNQIPAVFVYPADVSRPGWQGYLMDRIQHAGVRPYDASRTSYSPGVSGDAPALDSLLPGARGEYR